MLECQEDDIERLKNRFLLCRNELRKAKWLIKFWSEEMACAYTALHQKDQGCFDFVSDLIVKEGNL